MFRASLGAILVATCTTTFAADWPGFLGAGGTLASADSEATPVKWSDTENIKWKIDLPGKGVSSPIVVGDRVFVTAYSGYGTGQRDQKIENLKRHLVCVNRSNGEQIWAKAIDAVLPEDPYSGMGVPAHGYASHTPVSDGKHVVAFFGKSGVVAFDMDGTELWRKSVGTGSGRMRWGSASSPVLYENLVIVNASDESETMFAFDIETGKEVWKTPAADLANSWGTPLLVKSGERTDLVIGVPYEVWGMNPETGKLRWYSRGTEDNSSSASLAPGDDGVVFATGGRGGVAVAVRAGGKGDVNQSHVVWDANIQGRFATPVFHDGHLYGFASGIMTCYDAKTGDKVNQKRLTGRGEGGGDRAGGDRPGLDRAGPTEGGPGGGGFGGDRGGNRRGGGGGGFGNLDYASPVIADGKIYVTSTSGTFYVLSATPEMELLSTNKISDATGFGGTPAVSRGELFIRSGSKLYCVAQSK